MGGQGASLLLQLGPYIAVFSTLLCIWRFGVKPKFDKAEAVAVETTKWRTEVDSTLRAQKPLNADIIETSRWRIKAQGIIEGHTEEGNKILGSIASLHATLNQGNRDQTDQHIKMREFVEDRINAVQANVSEGRKEIFDKIEKIRDDLYTVKSN